jgi:pimeloyl-ACP methyl ester carboxylesterase
MTEFQTADLDRLTLSYAIHEPTGEEHGTVLLIHGFASTAQVNWINTSWVKTLNEAGFRTICFDNRGHGASQKFYKSTEYGPDIFADDAIALLDHLGVESCHVIGYSMGARITSWLASHAPDRVERAVIGGMGENIFGSKSSYEDLAEGLETDDISTISDPNVMTFRTFADRTKSDRRALAACIRKSQVQITPETVENISGPCLVVVGDMDETAGRAEPLAEMIPNGEAVTLPGLDHMKATGAKSFKDAALEFLLRD